MQGIRMCCVSARWALTCCVVVQVPRSSKLLSEDSEYALVTVVLFKRVVDDFKSACRTKGYQVLIAPMHALSALSAYQGTSQVLVSHTIYCP
jgi:V-ATPase subunit C